MGSLLLTHAEMHFLFSLAWFMFFQHKFRHILCPRRHWRRLVN